MSALPQRKHSEVLRDHLELAQARVLDVGCGDGSLVRLLAKNGAEAVGLDPSEGQVARARKAEPAGDECYFRGVAEALPFAEGSFDAVTFFNSLHHVPVEVQGPALAEAARCLKDGGLLYVQEPVAEGDYFELLRPVEDETYVRAKAYEAVKAAAASLLEEVTELVYLAPHKIPDFETLKDRLLAVDPGRRERLAGLEESLRAAFASAGEKREGATWFSIPSRLNLLRRPGPARIDRESPRMKIKT